MLRHKGSGQGTAYMASRQPASSHYAVQDGRTALHKASECNCLVVVSLLIESGADVNCVDVVRWPRQRPQRAAC